MDTVRASKRLSFILRHAPESIHIVLDEAGWVDVSVLLHALAEHGQPITRTELERVVADSDKQRFELDGERVRARQGHSVPVNLDLPPAAPPVVLFHGTPEANVESIRRHGLTRGARHHVHLSPDRETAERVGGRRGSAVVLAVEAARMSADGFVFFVTGNGVWLTDAVPPGYLVWSNLSIYDEQDQDKQITSNQAAALIGISHPHLLTFMDAGALVFTRVGGHCRIKVSDLVDFNERRQDARKAVAESRANAASADAGYVYKSAPLSAEALGELDSL